MHNLVITRDLKLSDTTLGKLNVDGSFYCFTLEDVIRPDGEKIQDKTCIPFSSQLPDGQPYKVKVTFSPHFNKNMPLIYNQPDLSIKSASGVVFAGVRFHGGNIDIDTDGCVLVAHNRSEEQHNIWESASDELEILLDTGEEHPLIIQ